MGLLDWFQSKLAPAPVARTPSETYVQRRTTTYKPPVLEELTVDEETDLLNSGVKVLTGEEKQIPIPKSMMGYICVLHDGTVLISSSHKDNPIIKQCLDEMERQRIKARRHFGVDMRVIKIFYERAERRSTAESSLEMMQKEVYSLIEDAMRWNATDMKIEYGRDRGSVRYCVNDQFIEVKQLDPEKCKVFMQAYYNLAATGDGTYKENEFQGAILQSTPTTPLPPGLEGVRLMFGPTAGNGRAVVARLLPSRTGRGAKKTMEDLGYDNEHITAMRQIRDNPFGAIFFCGPTGSGKTTTLAVSLEQRYIETQKRLHIVSLEDPAELEIHGTTQHNVAQNAFTQEERTHSFIKGFNALLRMKPHVIMVGEVRDLPAAQLFLKAAISGHQCWSSIHAKNALSVPMRMKEMGIESYIVRDSSIMVGLVFQRLVPRLCECKLPFDTSRMTSDKRKLVDVITSGDTGPLRMRNINGCAKCNKHLGALLGYAGQTVVAEVLQPDDEILGACIEGNRSFALNRWMENKIAITAFEHGLRKAMKGEVDISDIYEKVYDRHNLERLDQDPGRLDFVRGGIRQRRPRPIIAAARMPDEDEAVNIVTNGKGGWDAFKKPEGFSNARARGAPLR